MLLSTFARFNCHAVEEDCSLPLPHQQLKAASSKRVLANPRVHREQRRLLEEVASSSATRQDQLSEK